MGIPPRRLAGAAWARGGRSERQHARCRGIAVQPRRDDHGGDGIASALEQASRTAGRKDVALAGGASAARQYLNAGLVNGMEIHLVPVLLGAGERLFDGVKSLGGLTLARTVATPGVTHLKFVR